VIGPLVRRLARTLRRSSALSPTASAYAVHGAPALGEERREQPRLDELVAAAPDIRPVLLARARESGLLAGVVSAAVLPAWTFVDRVVAPADAGVFLRVRLLCVAAILLMTAVLALLPVGRQRPELLTFGVLVVVQVDVAWMTARTGASQSYVMGLTLAIYGIGCVLVVRPRWTLALVATTWLALALFLLRAPQVRAADLVMTAGYVGTASLIAVLGHLRRHASTVRELATRLRLEQEQRRTTVLLGRLDRLSHEDPLTGLANRRRWDAEVASVCTETRERGGVVSLLLLDLDHFKQINDAHGHPDGDEVLRRVAVLLGAAVRGDDLVARLGGDEFAVLLPGAPQARAVALAEQLRCAAAGVQIEGFLPGEVSLSVGVAEAVGPEAFPLELMSRADEQLYRAKITRNAVGARPCAARGDGAPDGRAVSALSPDGYRSGASAGGTTSPAGAPRPRIGEDE
jgi:diguanylate cyclase (GGDEF)-like protein